RDLRCLSRDARRATRPDRRVAKRMTMPPDSLFIDSPPNRRRPFIATAIVLVAILVVGGAALVTAGGASTNGYRTATVPTRSVDQRLTEVGTVEPVSQATVAFPIAGTVANVDVTVGQQVAVGAQLASLETASLQATATQKQAALDQAELTLQQALNGES